MNQEDHGNRNTELLYRLDEKVVEVLRRFDVREKEDAEHRAANNAAHIQFNDRLANLENFRWWFLGVAGATSILVNYLKDWILRGIK